MPATIDWIEDWGASTGSPAKGTTRTTGRTEMNYKSTDDPSAGYSSNPITRSNNSFSKYMAVHFTGSFNTISNVKWSPHHLGTLGTGLSIHGQVRSTYTTPSASTNNGMNSPTDFTTLTDVSSGLSVSLSTTGPEDASPVTSLTSAGYTQFLISQMSVSGSATTGDAASITSCISYDET